MISDDISRKPDVTYHAANGKLMHFCGPVELTVKIIFDELTNNIDTSRSFTVISATHYT